jgi:oxygen-dependent protoporphyrinogen oxidase
VSTIAVVGGGIAGLTAAHRLADAHEVIVFERESVPGGKIRSERIAGGYLFEWGPSGFLASADAVQSLVDDLGLRDVLTPASEAAKKRYIYWNGRLHALPAKPPEALKMTILSPLGKLRAFRELFVAKGAGEEDESVLDFMQRRFGREVAERLVAPALLGVSGGDAATTSLAAMFPRVREIEAEHGSVLRGMMKGPRRSTSLTSFADGGMQTLTDHLAERLGARFRGGTAVDRIERDGAGWRVVHAAGTTAVDAVIVTTPAAAAARLLDGVDGALAAKLREIPYAPMRVVGVAFRPSDLPVPLDGFGFLAARNQGVRLLGAFFTSTIIPEHAPPGTAYLRIFLGGSTDPGIAALDADAVKKIVLEDLRTVLGITAEPIAHHEMLWPEAIPQYGLQHRAIVTAIEAHEAALPGLALAGNAYRGLGVGDTVRDAIAVADRISATLPVNA